MSDNGHVYIDDTTLAISGDNLGLVARTIVFAATHVMLLLFYLITARASAKSETGFRRFVRSPYLTGCGLRTFTRAGFEKLASRREMGLPIVALARHVPHDWREPAEGVAFKNTTLTRCGHKAMCINLGEKSGGQEDDESDGE